MAGVMMRARPSQNRKFVLCAACRTTLCRRDFLSRVKSDNVFEREQIHELVWDSGWFVTGDHIEAHQSQRMRLDDGRRPTRHMWPLRERVATINAIRAYAPAKCPQCGETNEIDAMRLDVQNARQDISDVSANLAGRPTRRPHS